MVINKNIIILLFLSIIVFGQNKNKLDDKSSELKVIQQQIQNLEGELSELSKKEKNNVSILKKLDQQNLPS